MAITNAGKKILKFYRKKFGTHAEREFFSSIKKDVPGSKTWYEPEQRNNNFTSSLKG